MVEPRVAEWLGLTMANPFARMLHGISASLRATEGAVTQSAEVVLNLKYVTERSYAGMYCWVL